MDRDEVINRIKKIAKHAVHTAGEPPFVLSLDDGIALKKAISILEVYVALKPECCFCPHCANCDVDKKNMRNEPESDYERGFNDAMLGKQDLMHEGVDGMWHRKDW